MATLSVLTPTQVGGAGGLVLVGTVPTATTGDTFPNTGEEILEILNGSSAACTVTIDGALDENGREQDCTLVVSAGSRAAMGPFRRGLFNNGAGSVGVLCSIVASVQLTVYRPFRPAR